MLKILNLIIKGLFTLGHDLPSVNCISGTYEIQSDVLTGKIEKIAFPGQTDVLIEVIRGSEIIATGKACPIRTESDDSFRGSYFSFYIPVKERFCAAELLNEYVYVRVRGPRGDTGRLRMDGAFEMELIRTIMGRPVEVVLDLDFTGHGNIVHYLGEGWWGKEDDYTWTVGKESLIHFASPSKAGKHVLRLRASAYVRTTAPIQRLSIYINEQFVDSILSDNALLEYREFHLPKNAFEGTLASKIRLHHPLAVCRSEHEDTSDCRYLAYAFRRISIVRLLEEET